jgi:hypothetical protein
MSGRAKVNDRERERLREFINRLDDALAAPANEYWTVAGVLGHLAYWDNRVLVSAKASTCASGR